MQGTVERGRAPAKPSALVPRITQARFLVSPGKTPSFWYRAWPPTKMMVWDFVSLCFQERDQIIDVCFGELRMRRHGWGGVWNAFLCHLPYPGFSVLLHDTD